jgi:hypothetical protein
MAAEHRSSHWPVFILYHKWLDSKCWQILTHIQGDLIRLSDYELSAWGRIMIWGRWRYSLWDHGRSKLTQSRSPWPLHRRGAFRQSLPVVKAQFVKRASLAGDSRTKRLADVTAEKISRDYGHRVKWIATKSVLKGLICKPSRTNACIAWEADNGVRHTPIW